MMFDAGWIGSGSCVLVDELGPPVTPDSNIPLNGVFLPDAGSQTAHANLVTGMVKLFAPAAKTYFGFGSTFNGTFTIPTWPYDGVYCGTNYIGCNTVNYSNGLNSFGLQEPIDNDNLYFDYVNQLTYVKPIVVTATGNMEGCVTVDAGRCQVDNLQYNGLHVGYNHFVDAGSGWVGTRYGLSAWVNPVTPHGDRELPELCGPAYETSLSAPEVSGTLAAMQQVNSVSLPEAERAVIMATATPNLENPAVRFSLAAGHPDHHCGVGQLNSFAAASLWQRANFYGGREPYYQFDGGGQTNAFFQASAVDFSSGFPDGGFYLGSLIYQPSNLITNVRFVLAFDAASTCSTYADPNSCTATQLDADLDLLIFDQYTGALVGSSITYDNSYEVVDMIAPFHRVAVGHFTFVVPDNLEALVVVTGTPAVVRGDFGLAYSEY